MGVLPLEFLDPSGAAKRTLMRGRSSRQVIGESQSSAEVPLLWQLDHIHRAGKIRRVGVPPPRCSVLSVVDCDHKTGAHGSSVVKRSGAGSSFFRLLMVSTRS